MRHWPRRWRRPGATTRHRLRWNGRTRSVALKRSRRTHLRQEVTRTIRQEEVVVFCQQCGAEAPIRALTCPTCGHDLGRSAADLRSSMVPSEPSSSSPGTSNLSLPLVTPSNSASIRPGDLDRPGWPRDALGRILLLVVLALEVDLFLLPWRLVGSQHETLPTSAG